MTTPTPDFEDRALIPIVAPVNGAVLTPTSFTPDHELTRDEWVLAGQSLGAASTSTQWWIGDWLNYGVHREYIPEGRYDVAEEITKLSRTWLQVCAWVSRAWEPADRRANLSFEHHKRLAALKSGEVRTLLLEHAETKGWSARDTYAVAVEVMAPRIELPSAGTTAPVHPIDDDTPLDGPQLIELGPHRLVIGDATDPEAWALLFEGQPQAHVLWTDPPYGVEYVGKTEDAMTIENDDLAGLASLLLDSFTQADLHLKDGCGLYIAHSDRTAPLFHDAMTSVGWKFHENLIWVKNRMVLGRSDYQGQYEPIAYGFKGLNHRWFGGRDRVNVFGLGRTDDGHLEFTIPNPQASVDHPTMKPPRLIWEHLRNSTLTNEIVLDMFAGSGSTMVAAHELGLRCFMMELSPKFAQTIVLRWKELSGDNNAG